MYFSATEHKRDFRIDRSKARETQVSEKFLWKRIKSWIVVPELKREERDRLKCVERIAEFADRLHRGCRWETRDTYVLWSQPQITGTIKIRETEESWRRIYLVFYLLVLCLWPFLKPSLLFYIVIIVKSMVEITC